MGNYKRCQGNGDGDWFYGTTGSAFFLHSLRLLVRGVTVHFFAVINLYPITMDYRTIAEMHELEH
jgi:hypothetical protein